MILWLCWLIVGIMAKLHVLTFNVWGLSISPDRTLRMNAIMEKILSSPEYDVIVMQELWMNCDYEMFKKGLADLYPHTAYFYSGIVGSGLATFSKWPIRETQFLRYAISGRADSPHHGDWYAGKGAAMTKIEHPQLGTLLIFNTHLVANYHDFPDRPDLFDPYELQRIMQTVEYVRFIKQVARGHPEALCIAMGDWNEEEDSLAWQLAVDNDQQLRSVWSFLPSVPADARYTFNHPKSMYWRSDKAAQQIDHILLHSQSNGRQIKAISAKVAFDEPISVGWKPRGRQHIGYSDHFALSAVIEVQPREAAKRGSKPRNANDVQERLKRVIGASLGELKYRRQRYLLLVSTLMITLTIFLPIILMFMWPRRGLGRFATLFLAFSLPIATATIIISWWMGMIEYWEEVSAIKQFIQELGYHYKLDL